MHQPKPTGLPLQTICGSLKKADLQGMYIAQRQDCMGSQRCDLFCLGSDLGKALLPDCNQECSQNLSTLPCSGEVGWTRKYSHTTEWLPTPHEQSAKFKSVDATFFV